MAETPDITINLDPDALREQIRAAVATEFEQLAWRLRWAADALDAGQFANHWDEEMAAAEKRGYERGRAEAAKEGEQ